jgi:putative addiction module CopG family antidote
LRTWASRCAWLIGFALQGTTCCICADDSLKMRGAAYESCRLAADTLDSAEYVRENRFTMASIIPTEFQPFVSDAVASGRYRSEEELIAAALRLLEDRERKLGALRGDLEIGLEELDRGDTVELGDAAVRRAFFDDIKARGRERLSSRANRDPHSGER